MVPASGCVPEQGTEPHGSVGQQGAECRGLLGTAHPLVLGPILVLKTQA